jgi:hypothetical protein
MDAVTCHEYVMFEKQVCVVSKNQQATATDCFAFPVYTVVTFQDLHLNFRLFITFVGLLGLFFCLYVTHSSRFCTACQK